MTEENKAKLDQLIGNTYTKGNKTFTVKSYKEINSLIVVLTSNGTFNCYPRDLDTFIAKLTLVPKTESSLTYTPPEPPTAPGTIAPPIIEKTELHLKIETSLNDMIDKVIANKEAIPQATALCNIANTMINLEKQQINLLKATKKI